MKPNRPAIILAIVLVLLLIPFIAMQFTQEVAWTSFDFMVMALLLFGMGFLIELAMRKTSRIKYRIMLCLAVFGVFFIVWVELAVGIFNFPFSGH